MTRASLRSLFRLSPGAVLRCGVALALASLSQAVCTNYALGATAPHIFSVTPTQGSVVGGERVTINGSGFLGPSDSCSGQYQIAFGFDLVRRYAITPPSYQVLSDRQISVVVPPNFGGPVNVRVHDSCGWSSDTAGDTFTYDYPANQCLSGSCSISIGSTPKAPLRHAGVGFLDGFNVGAGVMITSRDTRLVDALHPRQWRLGQAWLTAPGGGVFALARQSGAKVSLDLTTDWENWAYNDDHANYAAPYNDLATYYSFIYNDVKRRLAADQVPDYFDVWNEPVSRGTVNQWLSVYGTAYRAIKAVDPAAQVVGPSIDAFLITSAGRPNSPGYQLSLTDFLKWEVTSGDRFAAISWHEDGATVDGVPSGAGLAWHPLPGGYRDYWSPSAIATHIRQAKKLLAQYPALTGTQIFVNEYGPTYGANVPGWMVGDFQALETAGADEGMITCATGDACNSLLDGLIGFDGAPQMPYWVMKAYSQMSGSRVPTSSSGTNFFALAVRDGGSRTVEALIGRADDCFGGVQCPQFHQVSAASVNLTFSVLLPWTLKAVTVSIQRFRNGGANPIGLNDVATAPPARLIRGVAVHNGRVSLSVPPVYDGDALYLTVRPDSHPGERPNRARRRQVPPHHHGRRHRRLAVWTG